MRRLLPALYAMVALTSILSFQELLTSERPEFFRSAATVVSIISTSSSGGNPATSTMRRTRSRCCIPGRSRSRSSSTLALPVLVWALLRAGRGARLALPLTLGALTLASFVLSVSLMRTGSSANAFFLSPPRAWEFLIGGLGRAAERAAVAGGVGARRCARHRPGGDGDPRSSRAATGAGNFPASTRPRALASAPPCSSGAAPAMPTLAARHPLFAAAQSLRFCGRHFAIRRISGTGRSSPSRGSPRRAWCSIPSTRPACSP